MKEPNNLILKCIAGSHLYGLSTPYSDMDIRGIYLDDIDDMLNINGRQNTEISDDKQDVKYYSLGKFLKLASECNPNIIELLFIPDDAIIEKSQIYDELVSHRDWFMSKKAKNSFLGYAYAQLQRAKGIDKKCNSIDKYVDENGIRIARMFLNQPEDLNFRIGRREYNKSIIANSFCNDFVKYLEKENVPWNETEAHLNTPFPITIEELIHYHDGLKKMMPPKLSNFIHWYRHDNNGFPFRKVNFNDNCNDYDASKVEGSNDLYRLYHHGNGFFDENKCQIKTTNISKQREYDHFAGVVHIDFNQYKIAIDEYLSFWKWMANRNESRYSNDWDRKENVDLKNMMHTMRLLFSAKSIAENGKPKLRFDNQEIDFLMKIRNGLLPYDKIIEKHESLIHEIEDLFDKSNLPMSSDFNEINDFFINKIKEHILTHSIS